MFNKVCTTVFLLFFVLVSAGCSGGYSDEVGLEVADIVYLDDDYQAEITLEKGEVFGLDMPQPKDSAYAISGASFDPVLFRMERFIEYEDGGGRRIRYLFTALEDGASDVNLKMRPVSGGAEDVYRTVHVSVGGGSGILF